LTKSTTDLIFEAINATVLENRRRRTDFDNGETYQKYKDYKKYEETIQRMVLSSAAILHLPGEMTWDNIKATMQVMWKKAIPQVHVYQFLTKTLDYLEVDTTIDGMSKLSPYLTKRLVDMMWGMFGYLHPISNHD